MNKEYGSFKIARSMIAIAQLFTFNLTKFKSLFESYSLDSGDYWDQFSIYYLFGIKNLSVSLFITNLILIFVLTNRFVKISSILHFWISYSFLQSAVLLEGGDQVNLILCFFIVLITFSDYTKNPKAVKYIIYLLLSLQVSFIYLQAAFSKFYVPEWQNGTAFYYWVYHNTFGSILVEFSFFNFFLGAPIVVLLMTWGAILIELTLAYSLFFSKISKIYAFYLGCVFHLFIMFFLGLGSFSITMMACLVMYCLPQKISINDILQRSNKV